MKSFQAVIIAALAISSTAINEPVASPTAAIERELAEYERQLGTDVSPAPSRGGDRPGVSYNIYLLHLELCQLLLATAARKNRTGVTYDSLGRSSREDEHIFFCAQPAPTLLLGIHNIIAMWSNLNVPPARLIWPSL